MLQLAVYPESNIICFRYLAEDRDDIALNRINSEIRDKIIKEGSFYIVQVELNGKIWLRLTIINPVTLMEHLKELLKRVLEIGRKLQLE